VVASIGAAVGLGNFWRFPGLTYRYGGFGNFIVPYLCALVFFGIPLLLMELGLGQKYQRGDVSVFRAIHPRLAGVGIVSVLCSFIITLYYTVMIGWGLVYFVSSCMSPLPWSEKDDKNFGANCLKAEWNKMMAALEPINVAPDWSLADSCPEIDSALAGELVSCANNTLDINVTGGLWSPKLIDNWAGNCPSASYIEERELATDAAFDWNTEVDS